MKINFVSTEKTEVYTKEQIISNTDEMRRIYDNKEIISYNIVFKDGALIKQCHDLDKLDLNLVDEIVIMYKNKKDDE